MMSPLMNVPSAMARKIQGSLCRGRFFTVPTTTAATAPQPIDPNRKVWAWRNRKIRATKGTLAARYARYGTNLIFPAITRVSTWLQEKPRAERPLSCLAHTNGSAPSAVRSAGGRGGEGDRGLAGGGRRRGSR